jgi:hypothetical protein
MVLNLTTSTLLNQYFHLFLLTTDATGNMVVGLQRFLLLVHTTSASGVAVTVTVATTHGMTVAR